MTDNPILYVELPETLHKKLEEITSGPEKHYGSKSEFVRAAIREKIQRENL